MSISIHSETSKDEIETEEAELEDLVWNLMSRTGLLSQIQGQISKFIEDNGKTENVTSSIYPERADGRILGFIFEYLQWVGMKQTNSVLLSESPAQVDVSIYESRVEGPDYKPELCKFFDDHITDEGKDLHNYSRDEFEDSRLTSASGHQSNRSDNVVEDEASQTVNDSEEEESYSSHKQARNKIMSKTTDADATNAALEESRDTPEATFTVPDKKLETDIMGEDMISFNSPALPTRGFDQIRPHVTLRQRFDANMIPDPFQSPVSTPRMQLDSVPIVDSNNRLNFVKASNSLEEILSDDRKAEETSVTKEDVPDGHQSSIRDQPFSVGKPINVQNEEDQEDKSAKKSHKSEPKVGTREPPSASQDEEESTSDFMDMLTMEDDTQDASIESDSKGMSSCEHAVSLK